MIGGWSLRGIGAVCLIVARPSHSKGLLQARQSLVLAPLQQLFAGAPGSRLGCVCLTGDAVGEERYGFG